MMFGLSPQEFAAVLAIGSALAGAAAFCWKILKRLDVIGEGVLGKAAVVDRSGAEIEPAVPSLQARVSSLETLMSNGNTESRLTALETWREAHTREATEVAQQLFSHIANHADGK